MLFWEVLKGPKKRIQRLKSKHIFFLWLALRSIWRQKDSHDVIPLGKNRKQQYELFYLTNGKRHSVYC